MKQNVVILSGAGISAESGISTFRDSNGLWENHDIYDVATPEGWNKNPILVNRFYNERRKQLLKVKPNEGHMALLQLEEAFNVYVITQNVDDLHEQAGSKHVLHLHGELKKVRSTKYPELIYELEGWELKMGDQCERGAQLRPHIVWFGEAVPKIAEAEEITSKADVLIIVGTSLNVYPAAGLRNFVKPGTKVYLVDPGEVETGGISNLTVIKSTATEGLLQLIKDLLKEKKVD
jgi:NAD-dependent deacetylase